MKNNKFDIVIVGGGVVGASVAYELSKDSSLSIALIDIKKPGNATQASAGGLWAIGESVGLGCGVIFFKTLSKKRQENHGVIGEVARPHQLPPFFFDFCLKSNDMFPGLYKELIELGACDFKLEKTGLKFIMYDQDDLKYAQGIYNSIPHLKDQMAWLNQEELIIDEPFINKKAIGALEFLKDDQVNPYLLMNSFRDGARINGAEIIKGEVTDVEVINGKVQSVTVNDGKIHCNTVVNAAGAWAKEIGNMVGLSLPIEPVKGQVLLSEKLPPIMRSCISTSDCYIAQKDNGEVLIGSTTENIGYETSGSLSHLRSLAAGAVKALPLLRNIDCKRTWAGLRPGTPDEVPILGPVDGIEGYLNACGHFRTGILTSAITARIISDLVNDNEPIIDLKPFLLDRFSKKVVNHSVEKMEDILT